MKNRFGPVDEVGCFDLSAEGITAVTDPTGLFVEHHGRQVAGTCVAVTHGGAPPDARRDPGPGDARRSAERPRRTTSGLDGSRVAMVLAVLQQHCGIRLHTHDVFASTVGGARVTEPASDLAVAVALASATRGVAAPMGAVAMGEIGLAGELRRVRDLPQRIAEAARLGFAVAVVPDRAPRARRRLRPARRRGHARDRGARRRVGAAPARRDPTGRRGLRRLGFRRGSRLTCVDNGSRRLLPLDFPPWPASSAPTTSSA